ncbi:MAG: hypothetical protein AB7V13_11670 [Pseudorhodoplanes sp.]|uniref:hypothetical protein n=1 Tax=Pseudorhodoplanes sp. TaxID=1934341 RepID=UPI003D102AB7
MSVMVIARGRFAMLALSAALFTATAGPAPATAGLDASSARKSAHKSADRPVRVKRVHPPVYRWRPADPSFDQHGRPYRPPPGLSCPIDLGYGRWTSCDNARW